MREMLAQFTGSERFPAFWTLAKHLLPRGTNLSSTDSTSAFPQQNLVGYGGDVEFRRPMSQRLASSAFKYVLIRSHCGKVKRQRRVKHLTAGNPGLDPGQSQERVLLLNWIFSGPQTGSNERPRELNSRLSPGWPGFLPQFQHFLPQFQQGRGAGAIRLGARQISPRPCRGRKGAARATNSVSGCIVGAKRLDCIRADSWLPNGEIWQ